MPWLLLLLVGAGQVVNFSAGIQYWQGDPLLSASWVWTVNHLTLFSVSAISAYVGGKYFWQEGASLWAKSPLKTGVFPAVAGALTAAACLPSVAATVWAAASLNAFPWDEALSFLYIFLGGLLSVAFVVVFSMTVGALYGKMYGVLVALAVELPIQLSSYVQSSAMLTVGTETGGSLVGLKVNPYWALLQLAFLLSLTGLCLWLTLKGRWELGAKEKLKFLGAVVCASFLVKVISPAPFVLDQAFRAEPVCQQVGEASLCLLPQHEHLRSKLAPAWKELHEKAKEAGSRELPSVLKERPITTGISEATKADQGRSFFIQVNRPITEAESGPVSVSHLIQTLVNADWCPANHADYFPEEIMRETDRAEAGLSAAVSAKEQGEREAGAREFDEAWRTLKTCPGGQAGK
ncbi:hypothetical protein KRX56_02425 [Dermabacteraceae bacterium TAE3-ERU27]|nr:hypothetical protein [Dermabacteraceae bacterium TAE3-ERU27]